MNKAIALSFLVGTTEATYAACTANPFACGMLYDATAACTTRVPMTLSQTNSAVDSWWSTYTTGYGVIGSVNYCKVLVAGSTSESLMCDSGKIKKQTWDTATCTGNAADVANSEIDASANAASATNCASYESWTASAAGSTPIVTQISFRTADASCTSQDTSSACTASFFACGQRFNAAAGACTAGSEVVDIMTTSVANVPAIQVDCVADPNNLTEQNPLNLRWFKGNCAAAVTVSGTTTPATYKKIVYGDSACTQTAAPYVDASAGSTIIDATCYAGATGYPGATATTGVKYHLLAATCAYQSPVTYTSCSILANFFKCSNKFNANTCASGEEVAQTSAQSNYTAQTVNDGMQVDCLPITGNTSFYTKGVCDATAGYYLATFKDANCEYNDTNTAITGLIEIGGTSCNAVAVSSGSTTEWARYFTSAGTGTTPDCTFTEAQQYGAKPFMMAASAAMVAAASMF